MKRAVLFVVIALLGGLALGALFGSGMSSAAQAMARGATPAEAILAAAPSVYEDFEYDLNISLTERRNAL